MVVDKKHSAISLLPALKGKTEPTGFEAGKKGKKGLRQPFDSPFELGLNLCFQQECYGGWASG
jgi:hypothetical protein